MARTGPSRRVGVGGKEKARGGGAKEGGEPKSAWQRREGRREKRSGQASILTLLHQVGFPFFSS